MLLEASSGLPPRRVNQVDLVPTIATLVGTGIPLGSSGVVIEEVVEAAMGTEAVERALRRNWEQMSKVSGRGGAQGNKDVDEVKKVSPVVHLCHFPP